MGRRAMRCCRYTPIVSGAAVSRKLPDGGFRGRKIDRSRWRADRRRRHIGVDRVVAHANVKSDIRTGPAWRRPRVNLRCRNLKTSPSHAEWRKQVGENLCASPDHVHRPTARPRSGGPGASGCRTATVSVLPIMKQGTPLLHGAHGLPVADIAIAPRTLRRNLTCNRGEVLPSMPGVASQRALKVSRLNPGSSRLPNDCPNEQ